MKSRIAVFLVVLMGVALVFVGATSAKDEAALDPNLVRSDNLDFWEEVGWTDMTPAEKWLWQKLSWTEASWNEEEKPPASEDKYWKQLTDEERYAAERLGYTKASWDEE
jgi:hypothetical protein